MKLHLTHFAILISISVSLHANAQTQVSIPNPPGYTSFQLRYANGCAIDNANNYWVAYNNIGLAKYDGSAWTVYDSLTSPLSNNKILSVAAGASGVWAGTNSGLFFFDGSTWTRYYTGNSNIPSDSITTLYAKGNEVWYYSNSGFVYFNGTSFQQFTSLNSGVVNDSVNCIYKDNSGTLWIGTHGGLSGYNGTWQSFTTTNSNLPDNDVRSLTEDGNHFLFVGTFSRGLVIKQGNSFVDWNGTCTYFTSSYSVRQLLPVTDGSVLLMNHTNIFITTNPISNVQRLGSFNFVYTDTTRFYSIDNLNRIWEIKKTFSYSSIKRLDSVLTSYITGVLSPGYATLDVNEVSCPIWSDNAYFWDEHANNNVALYEVPKGCGRTSIFAHALWLGGMDIGGNLHIAAQTYRQENQDWWSGPLDTVTATIDSATMLAYNKVWKVNRDTINNFVIQYTLGNITSGNYPIAAEIASWPGNGGGNTAHQLAPYIDVNGDGNYNPLDGDYPDIKGDQMLWWVMNDNLSPLPVTTRNPIGVEVQSEAWAYNCPGLADSMQSINYTTFYSYKIINRSSLQYNNTYVGMWTDVDLGNASDDFIGCRVDGDYGFVYNGDNDDEGPYGYGVNPPMTSVAMLRGPEADPDDGIDNNHNGVTDEPGENCMMSHFMYFINSPPNWSMGDPTVETDYYTYLTGHWKDGTHLTYGGNGYDQGCGATAVDADYAFTGMPYDTGWTEASACDVEGDRRFDMSSGPFTMLPGAVKTLDYAIVFSWDRDNANGLTTSIAKNHHDVMQIKNWFESGNYPCHTSSIGINEIANGNKSFTLFPNPATGSVTINAGGKFSSETTLQLFDISGRELLTEKHNTRNITVDISVFNRGVYFVELSDAGNRVVKKIVLQ